MLRASLDACRWAEVLDFGIVPDTREAVAAVMAKAATRCDAIVTTGGVSAGEEDHVTWAVATKGGTLDVVKVAMRPGKPVKVGRLGAALFLGLPGNPNATLVTFRMIALPALRKLAGLTETDPKWTRAVAEFVYEKRADRTELLAANPCPLCVFAGDANMLACAYSSPVRRGVAAADLLLRRCRGVGCFSPQKSALP
jgi:molybdopterin molybdotransferase